MSTTLSLVYILVDFLSWSTSGWGWYRQTCLSPPVFYLLNVPGWCFFCVSFLLFVFRVILSCLSIAALWSPAGKRLTYWLSCVWCFLVFLSLSHVVSWVWCGIWLYWFLILDFFLPLINWLSLEPVLEVTSVSFHKSLVYAKHMSCFKQTGRQANFAARAHNSWNTGLTL